MVQLVEEFGSSKEGTRSNKILKMWFYFLKLQVCAHLNTEQIWRVRRSLEAPEQAARQGAPGGQEIPESEAHLMAWGPWERILKCICWERVRWGHGSLGSRRNPDCESRAETGLIIRIRVAMSVCFLPQLSVTETQEWRKRRKVVQGLNWTRQSERLRSLGR